MMSSNAKARNKKYVLLLAWEIKFGQFMFYFQRTKITQIYKKSDLETSPRSYFIDKKSFVKRILLFC